MKPVIVHALPNRVRLRVEERWSAAADAVVKDLQARRGVRAVDCNPLTGSILVQLAPGSSVNEVLADFPQQARSMGLGPARPASSLSLSLDERPWRRPRILDERHATRRSERRQRLSSLGGRSERQSPIPGRTLRLGSQRRLATPWRVAWWLIRQHQKDIILAGLALIGLPVEAAFFRWALRSYEAVSTLRRLAA